MALRAVTQVQLPAIWKPPVSKVNGVNFTKFEKLLLKILNSEILQYVSIHQDVFSV